MIYYFTNETVHKKIKNNLPFQTNRWVKQLVTQIQLNHLTPFKEWNINLDGNS